MAYLAPTFLAPAPSSWRHMKPYLPLLACLAVACAGPARAIDPSDRIVLTDLGAGVIPTAINNVGQVAGQTNGTAFRWANGTLAPLGTLGGAQSYANDLNDSGVVVGWARDSAGKMKSFRWGRIAGPMENLDSSVVFEGAAEGINNEGQVVGWRTNGNAVRSTLWDPANATFLTGEIIFGSFNHKLIDINNSGEAVGLTLTEDRASDEGFYWDGDDITDITTQIGSNYFPYAGINDNRIAAGARGGASYYVYPDTFTSSIPTLHPLDTESESFGLNDLNIVVGRSGAKGFLYDIDAEKLYDANSFQTVGAPFDSITRLTDINNSNAFVGVGLINGIEHGLYGEFDAPNADFDGINGVNGADLTSWRTGFGAGATHAAGDADYDQDVDGADFLIWQRQLGSAGGGPSNVPEPSALWLACLVSLALKRR